MKPKTIARMTGYKATDANMQCRGHQFTLGVWCEVEGPIELCSHGFHFCDHPSGPWEYYTSPESRIFTCEAEEILDLPRRPGAGHKRVARRIRLVQEITPGHSVNRNNTGDRNAGDSNAGDFNTGDRNTGSGNTGDRNTGDSNAGRRNTGDGNATDSCTGFFCTEPQTVACFDTDTGLTYEQFLSRYPIAADLTQALRSDHPIAFEPYQHLPGITPEKLEALHQKHRAAHHQHPSADQSEPGAAE